MRIRWPRLVAVLAVLTVALTACGADQQPEASTSAALPDWLTKVYPPPGAETTATRAVQVEYPVAPRREVRLIIDGTDVTTYARVGPGLLEYDIDQDAAPVELRPGMHSATVELYDPSIATSESAAEFEASERELIDSYTWEFELL